MEKLKSEVTQLKKQCEELQESRNIAIKELLELKDRFQIELSQAQTDLIDETVNDETIDRRLCELRTEVSNLYCNTYTYVYRDNMQEIKNGTFFNNKPVSENASFSKHKIRVTLYKQRIVGTADILLMMLTIN